jgi:hypothetical protein
MRSERDRLIVRERRMANEVLGAMRGERDSLSAGF